MEKLKRELILKLIPVCIFAFCIIYVLLLSLVLGAVISYSPNSSSSSDGTYTYNSTGIFPENVEAYRGLVTKYCSEFNTEPDKLDLPKYVNAMLALLQVESGGEADELEHDPMQASECGYNEKFPRKSNGITDPEYSIQCGIQYARDAFIKFGVTGPDDIERMAAAIQGYNFGIDRWYNWIKEKNDGKYTLQLAKEYSATKMPSDKPGTPSHANKWIEAYTTALAKAEKTGPSSGTVGADGFVFYLQGNYPNDSYGSGTIKSCGCGVTSMAMIIATLADKKCTPVTMAAFSTACGGYKPNEGTSIGILTPAACEKYGLECKAIGVDDIKKYINDGALIIWGCHTGFFSRSSSGHVMTIRAVTKDGKILLGDPASEERSNTPYDLELIRKETNGTIYAVWKPGTKPNATEEKTESKKEKKKKEK